MWARQGIEAGVGGVLFEDLGSVRRRLERKIKSERREGGSRRVRDDGPVLGRGLAYSA